MFGKKKKQDLVKLEEWKGRFNKNRDKYSVERERMNRREEIYKGSKTIQPAKNGQNAVKAAHVRNVAAEMVESQVSSTLPQPKVTPVRPEDEQKAQIIEDLLRNLMDRLPMEYNNDMEERTVPIQGGAFALVEWDAQQRTHDTAGALKVTYIHPKPFTPQAGVTTDIEDMDYWFLEIPRTKAYIKRRYGVEVVDEGEEAPEVRGTDQETPSDEMVTQVLAYYRNEKGGIGLFSWAGDTVLEDLEDYQARRQYICTKCGQPGDGQKCRFCGSEKFDAQEGKYETLLEDIMTSDGRVIPAWSPVLDDMGMPQMEPMVDAAGNAVMQPVTDEAGNLMPDGMGGYELRPVMQEISEPTKIPYYKPDVYPLILRKNVSVYGRLLGDSDIDKIEDQQETIKKVETKVIEKLFKGGSVLTAPFDVELDNSDEELRILRLKKMEQKSMVGVFNLQPDIGGDMALLAQVYEEARQVVGITDSFQGRQDSTATSRVAKEFSAKQAAGRLESKRAMKDAFYSRLFEVMFKFYLAYADEPRRVVAKDNQGHTKYETFNRYDFLEQDEAGEFYWNDQFLFSVDASASLAQNREALWQECRLNFQQGCYGPADQLETLIVFWTRMETLHYPGASDTKTYLEEKLKEQQAAAMAQAQMMQVAQEAAGAGMMGQMPGAAMPQGGGMV